MTHLMSRPVLPTLHLLPSKRTFTGSPVSFKNKQIFQSNLLRIMSSDSSEDEDLDKFREAADFQFINDRMFDQKHEEQPPVEKLPSLRPRKDEDEQFNLFRLTPEFRNHVAKHLTKALDERLDQIMKTETNNNYTKPKRRKGGVKLLPNSTHYLKLTMKNTTLATPPKRSNTSNDNDDEEKLRSVAVSPEDILSKKETKGWSKRSKAPVYNYIKTENGLVLK